MLLVFRNIKICLVNIYRISKHFLVKACKMRFSFFVRSFFYQQSFHNFSSFLLSSVVSLMRRPILNIPEAHLYPLGCRGNLLARLKIYTTLSQKLETLNFLQIIHNISHSSRGVMNRRNSVTKLGRLKRKICSSPHNISWCQDFGYYTCIHFCKLRHVTNFLLL